MKNQTKTPTREPESQFSRSDPEPSRAAPQSSPPPTGYRRNGNVARLPKITRDKINLMLQDGVPYPAIIKSLGGQGKALGISSLSRWKDGGYKDWLLEQSFVAQVRDRLESASDLTRDFDATQVNHAALQLGTLHIFDAMRNLGPRSLDEKLGGDSIAFARLLNALARASRETLMLQKYREACAKARAALQPLRDPKRKLTEKERRSLVLMVDDILGLRDPDADSPSTLVSAAQDPASSPPPSPASPLPINTPIHRGESAPPESTTVSTVSYQAHSQDSEHLQPSACNLQPISSAASDSDTTNH